MGSCTTSAPLASMRRERLVEVGAGQVDPEVAALGHQLDDRASLVVGDARGDAGRVQDDGGLGLPDRPDGDPAHALVADVAADLEPEGVAVEGSEASGSVCGRKLAWMLMSMTVTLGAARRGRASRFLTGLVTCLATHGAIPRVASPAAPGRRSAASPTSSVNRVLKVPRDEQPTAKQTSVTLRSPRRSMAMARSIRRVMR